jgi:hypothetical protein
MRRYLYSQSNEAKARPVVQTWANWIAHVLRVGFGVVV